MDEVVKTERVKQKLVYAIVTYTNKSEKEISHMLYFGTLMLMNREGSVYQIYNPAEQSGDDYDRVIWDGVAHAAEMTYSSVSENYGNGGNYISSLKPGESIQVHMAWIVNENDLDHMYLDLIGDGSAYELSDLTLTGSNWITYCFAGLSYVKAIRWRKGESKMDEMVFLSILSDLFDFYWSTS